MYHPTVITRCHCERTMLYYYIYFKNILHLSDCNWCVTCCDPIIHVPTGIIIWANLNLPHLRMILPIFQLFWLINSKKKKSLKDMLDFFLCENSTPQCGPTLPQGVKSFTTLNLHYLRMLPHKFQLSWPVVFFYFIYSNLIIYEATSNPQGSWFSQFWIYPTWE